MTHWTNGNPHREVVIRVKHLGDITKINGAEIPVVDIITGGSPC